MTPREFLLYIALVIVLFNILTVEFRKRHALSNEEKLRKFAERSGRELSLEEISRELQIPLYDARILTRKFISSGKMEARSAGGKECYIFKT